MKELKRLVSLIVVIALVMVGVYITPQSVFAAADTGVKFEMVEAGNDVYKLVFQAKTPTQIRLLSLIFSFSNTVIKPVHRTNFTDVVISDGADVPATPFMVQTKTFREETPSSKLAKWKISGDRTAFDYTVYVSSSADYIESKGSYIDIFALYFKFQDGKSVGDIDADTFKFETAQDRGNLLPLFFSSPDNQYGVLLDEVPGISQYRWGHYNKSDWPSHCGDIGEVINPFNIYSIHVPEQGGSSAPSGNPAVNKVIQDNKNNNNQPPNTVIPFQDVKASDWFADAVMWVYEKGLMKGVGTNTMLFSPNSTLTRGMAVTILYRHAEAPGVSGLDNPFYDVPENIWYTDAIKWAAENGIVTGRGLVMGGDTPTPYFAPDSPITREELATILMRYMNYKKIVLPVTHQRIIFADEADISAYAMDAIQTFNKLGIINGIGTNANGQTIVKPKGNATRAETAAMIMRFSILEEKQ